MAGQGAAIAVMDQALTAWRRRASNVVIAASAIFHFPLVVLLVLGYGPWDPRPLIGAAVAGYLVTVAAALLRRIDFRIRVWAMLGALYLIASVGAVAVLQGPYIRALLIVAPVVAITLVGVGAARMAILVSALVLLSAPWLQSWPGLARLLEIDSGRAAPGPSSVQSAALIVEMIILMVLLERFYAFMLQALEAHRRAAAATGAAHRKLEGEIRERRRLEREFTRMSDEERRRLGSEVHDGICQQLTGALLRCEALERCLERGGRPSDGDIRALTSLLGETIDEAHAVARGLCPLDPDPEALAAALRALVKRTRSASGAACEFLASGDVRVPDAVMSHHLYRIAQEALSNAVRHARAGRIDIELSGTEDALTLRVADDGAGLPPHPAAGGMGLRSMDYRAQIIEGALRIDSAPGRGTRIVCRVPRAAFEPPDRETAAAARGCGP